MPVTVEDLRSRLGLRDPREHALEARWQMADARLKHGELGISRREAMTRRTGKTTEMILRALVHLANTGEEVCLVGHSVGMADHMKRVAGDFALRLGLDPRRIRGYHAANPDILLGRHDRQVFRDHVVTDGI